MSLAFVAGVATLGVSPAPAQAAPATLVGRLQREVAEDFARGRTEDSYSLRTDAGVVYDLIFSWAAASDVPGVGSRVSVSGRISGSTFTATAPPTVVATAAVAVTPAAVTGTKRVAVLMINFSDNASEPFTASDVQAVYSTNSDSVAAFYNETSWGQLAFTADVYGWYTIAASGATCDKETWSAQADAAASAAGVDLTTYDFVQYAFPPAGCWWAGFADQPGRRTWINDNNFTSVVAHELGHNLGLEHAASYGPGAERVVLAFAVGGRAAGDSWSADRGTAYGYKYNDSTRRPFSWPGGPDTLGQGYMMYLAGLVQPPAWRASGRKGVLSWTAANGVTTDASDIALVDNWETMRRNSYTSPFSAVKFGSRSNTPTVEAQFHLDIQTEIASGVPAQVAAAIWKLPSQAAHAHSGAHWIAIVGFDDYYYYYIETCVGATSCGEALSNRKGTSSTNKRVDAPNIYPDPFLASFQGDGTLNYRANAKYKWTWRIGKTDLWNAAEAYIKDNGYYANIGW